MNAVHNKVELFSNRCLRLMMKYPPMDDVFEKRPDHDADEKKSGNNQDRQSTLPERSVKHVGDHRHVEHERRRRMHMGEKLHQIAFEQARAFVA